MTISIIGIIGVQLFWMYTSLENNKEQFKYNVLQVLNGVGKTLENNELTDFYKEYSEMAKKSTTPPTKNVAREFKYIKRDFNTNQEIIYSNTLFQEDYNVKKNYFDKGLDTSSIYRYSSKRKTEIVDKKFIDNFGFDDGKSKSQVIENEGYLDAYDIANFNVNYRDIVALKPISDRIDTEELAGILKEELKKYGLSTDFEFCVYSKNLPTKVKSEDFLYNKDNTYAAPIFFNNDNQTNFQLLVSFPDKNEFLFSSLLGLSLLSILFTMIIIGTYYSAITQLKNQKEISEIKSDFINNMTHEFKTPIATINLALDSIKNPKIFSDSEKVHRYLGLIKEENKRMLAQVNNVLQISRLEKQEAVIEKEPFDVHELIQDGVDHVKLLVEDRQGKVSLDLQALESEVNLNQTHFTSIMVNLLDNAIKYSPEAPVINVKTFNDAPGSITIQVSDKGQGMSKTALKRVFEQFYREHTGNLHNVKGHGLGLAYVKRIVEDLNGQISVESEKGKGSTFTIKMPLI
ncbi:HAMP domain-containing histidine kinase [Flavobacterium agricola]|uniref:histidine kinase n=2 Tax=Flavobacterium agricola TaxID=2870839 RepID=A0ABY6M408_9FLAO|nr:HAMP domain-containing histidine kinase [Flavobacterium agricola]